MKKENVLIGFAIIAFVLGIVSGILLTMQIFGSDSVEKYLRGAPYDMEYKVTSSVEQRPEYSDVGVGEINVPDNYMIAKDYRLTIQHEDVNRVVNDIIMQANMLGGKLVSSNFGIEQYRDYGEVVVKIPVDKEKDFLAYLDDYKIIQSSVSVHEVSKQYMSLEERIELLKSKLDLYQEYVNSQELSPEVAERYYDKIFSLKSEIRYLERQKEQLDEKVSYSTFYIRITNEKEFKAGKVTINFSKVWYNIKLAWSYMFVLLIYFTAIVLPIGLVGFIIYKKVLRRNA